MESVFQHDKSMTIDFYIIVYLIYGMTFKGRSVRVTLEFLTFNIGLL